MNRQYLLITLVFPLLVWMVALSLAQDRANQAVRGKQVSEHSRLVLSDSLTVPTEVAGMLEMPIRCDSDGNLYIMSTVDGESGIKKLNPKGERLAVFRPSTISGSKIEVPAYFSINTSGEVFQLGFSQRSHDRYLMVYSSDASRASAVKLDVGFPFTPSVVTPFASGQVLVSGLKNDPDRASQVRWPFNGIFASNGSLLKEFSLSDDKSIHDMAESGDERVVPEGKSTINSAVQLGEAESAVDGNVYLMRRLNPAILYAISPGGAVVRRFTVDPGDKSYMPFAMHVGGRKIAVLFTEPQTRSQIIKVVDLEGHDIATYDDPEIQGKSTFGPAFACFAENPERLIFLGTTSEQKLQLKFSDLH